MPTDSTRFYRHQGSLLSSNLNHFAEYAHGSEGTWILRLSPGWSPNGQWRHPYTMARLFGLLCFAHSKREILDINPLCFANVRRHMATKQAIANYAMDLSALAGKDVGIVVDARPWQADTRRARMVLQRVVQTIEHNYAHPTILLQIHGYRSLPSVLSIVSRYPGIRGLLVDSQQ